MRKYLYKSGEEPTIFKDEDIKKALDGGWKNSPAETEAKEEPTAETETKKKRGRPSKNKGE